MQLHIYSMEKKHTAKKSPWLEKESELRQKKKYTVKKDQLNDKIVCLHAWPHQTYIKVVFQQW